MASIRNSISLTDHMTPTLRSIVKAMNSTLKVMEQVNNQSRSGVHSKAYIRAERDIQRANNAIIKMENYAGLAANGANGVADSWNNVNRVLDSSHTKFRNIVSSAASLIYTVKSVTRAISSMTDVADSALSDIAKLKLFNTSSYSPAQLYGQVYKTAQESRSDLSSTAGLTQRIMLSGTYEGEGAITRAIDLSGTINKAMVLGGGTTEENNRAIVQLSQALSSGLLQGDELRSIREQAPYLAKVLAQGLEKIDDKFIGTTIGDLKELGAQGKLTSDVVIKALEAMRGEIDSAFDTNAPKTFSGALTSISNTVQFFISILNQADGPLGKLNQALWQFADYLSTPQGFELLSSIIPVLNVVTFMFQGLSGAIQFVGNNLSWIAPIFGTILGLIMAYNTYMAISKALTWGQGIAQGIAAVASYIKAKADDKAARAAAASGGAAAASATAFTAQAMATSAATAAQHGLNAAFWASPVTWVIALIIVLIGLLFVVVGVINKVTGSSISALGIIVGALAVAIAVIWNYIFGVVEFALGCVSILINTFITFANFFANVFNDPIASVLHLFGGFADSVIGVVESIARAIDSVFGTGLADAVAGFRSQVSSWIEVKASEWGNGEYKQVMDSVDLSLESLGLSRWAYGDAWNAGYNAGDNLQTKIGDFNLTDLLSGVSSMPSEITGGDLDSVGKINSDVNIGDEDIKLLRDMAARDFLLQLQTVTPVAHVTFGDVRETADVNKIVEVIENMVEEQMATSLVS